jgi:hypothetical protein
MDGDENCQTGVTDSGILDRSPNRALAAPFQIGLRTLKAIGEESYEDRDNRGWPENLVRLQEKCWKPARNGRKFMVGFRDHSMRIGIIRVGKRRRPAWEIRSRVGISFLQFVSRLDVWNPSR